MKETNLLLRQIHPNFVDDELKPTSQAFKPLKRTTPAISVYDGEAITPEAAWQHFTRTEKLKSIGVMGLTQDHCLHLGLSVQPSPTPTSPHHMEVGFANLSRKDQEKAAYELKAAAIQRGWLYQPEETAEPSSTPPAHA